jgi:hypothetical protein
VAGADFVTVAPFCEGLEAAVKELTQALQGTVKPERAAKPLALLTQLAKAVQLALDTGKDEGMVAREVTEMVERIKARRAASAEDLPDGPAKSAAGA